MSKEVYSKPKSSPWGKPDSVRLFNDLAGIFVISTPGHGGIMIAKGVMNKLGVIPPELYVEYGNYATFEEDVQAIFIYLLLDLKELRKFKDQNEVNYAIHSLYRDDRMMEVFSKEFKDSERFQFLLNSISEEIKEKILKQVKKEKLISEMRSRRDPDLIVSALDMASEYGINRFLNEAGSSYTIIFETIRENGEKGLETLKEVMKMALNKGEKKDDWEIILEEVVRFVTGAKDIDLCLVFTADDRFHIVLGYQDYKETGPFLSKMKVLFSSH